MRKWKKIVMMCLLASALGTESVQAGKTDVKAGLKAGLQALDEKNYQKAFSVLGQAFAQGEADAAFYMGRMVEMGLGQERDPSGAAILFAVGSEKGSLLAKNRLGMLHIEGVGVLQDFKKGADLICSAADAGYGEALYNCGVLYQEGRGVGQDQAKAVSYFQKASDKGVFQAHNALAAALALGKGAARDDKKAFSLWRKTAEAGNPEGLFALGKAYREGIGTKIDPVKAHAYFNLASALGIAPAAVEREKIAKKLSKEDLEKAQEIARSWRPPAPQK